MNEYLLALLGLLGVFLVGAVVYGGLGKSVIGGNAVPLTPLRFAIAGAGMYIISLAFIYLFKNVTLGDATGVTKGIQLALLIGIPFTALPIFADGPYLAKNADGVTWTVIVNWLLALVVLGIIVGLGLN